MSSPSSPTEQKSQPTPQLIFQTLNAYQRTEALKAAIQLGVFTAIGEGNNTAESAAKKCNAAEKGVRVLCDFLTVIGLLTKSGNQYGLTADSAAFLDQRSPAYLGTVADFLLAPELTEGSKHLTEAVRKGGTALKDDGTLVPDNPIWVNFARAMAPMMAMPAQLIPKLADPQADRPLRVLDIAAGHGLFGIGFAKQNKQAEITALDWAGVLEVAKENAQKAGVSDRYHTLPGSAFDVDFGGNYDLVLLTNFLHHFDVATCEKLLRKVCDSLNEGGRAVILEFVPNDDRVTPPDTATFSMVMLASTPSGDAYTFAELESMARNAGFSRSTFHPLPPTIEQLVISEK